MSRTVYLSFQADNKNAAQTGGEVSVSHYMYSAKSGNIEDIAVNKHHETLHFNIPDLLGAALPISAATFSTASLTSRLWRPG